MTMHDESIEEKFARLSADTAGLRPRDDFALRVMAAIEDPSSWDLRTDWSLQVLRWAKVGTAMASLAAAACIFIAWDNTSAADQEEAIAYGMTEAFE